MRYPCRYSAVLLLLLLLGAGDVSGDPLGNFLKGGSKTSSRKSRGIGSGSGGHALSITGEGANLHSRDDPEGSDDGEEGDGEGALDESELKPGWMKSKEVLAKHAIAAGYNGFLHNNFATACSSKKKTKLPSHIIPGFRRGIVPVSWLLARALSLKSKDLGGICDKKKFETPATAKVVADFAAAFFSLVADFEMNGSASNHKCQISDFRKVWQTFTQKKGKNVAKSLCKDIEEVVVHGQGRLSPIYGFETNNPIVETMHKRFMYNFLGFNRPTDADIETKYQTTAELLDKLANDYDEVVRDTAGITQDLTSKQALVERLADHYDFQAKRQAMKFVAHMFLEVPEVDALFQHWNQALSKVQMRREITRLLPLTNNTSSNPADMSTTEMRNWLQRWSSGVFDDEQLGKAELDLKGKIPNIDAMLSDFGHPSWTVPGPEGAKCTRTDPCYAIVILGSSASGKTHTTNLNIHNYMKINKIGNLANRFQRANLKPKITIDGGAMRECSQLYQQVTHYFRDLNIGQTEKATGLKDAFKIVKQPIARMKSRLSEVAVNAGLDILFPETATWCGIKGELLTCNDATPVKDIKEWEKSSNGAILPIVTHVFVSKTNVISQGRSRELTEGKKFSAKAYYRSQRALTFVTMSMRRWLSQKYTHQLTRREKKDFAEVRRQLVTDKQMIQTSSEVFKWCPYQGQYPQCKKVIRRSQRQNLLDNRRGVTVKEVHEYMIHKNYFTWGAIFENNYGRYHFGRDICGSASSSSDRPEEEEYQHMCEDTLGSGVIWVPPNTIIEIGSASNDDMGSGDKWASHKCSLDQFWLQRQLHNLKKPQLGAPTTIHGNLTFATQRLFDKAKTNGFQLPCKDESIQNLAWWTIFDNQHSTKTEPDPLFMRTNMLDEKAFFDSLRGSNEAKLLPQRMLCPFGDLTRCTERGKSGRAKRHDCASAEYFELLKNLRPHMCQEGKAGRLKDNAWLTGVPACVKMKKVLKSVGGTERNDKTVRQDIKYIYAILTGHMENSEEINKCMKQGSVGNFKRSLSDVLLRNHPARRSSILEPVEQRVF